MEWNQEMLQFLSQCFLHTLSPAPGPRRQAESFLYGASERPNYALAVLRLVAESSVDEQIRQAAAVSFKNHLRTRWGPSPPDSDVPAPSSSPIPDSEKEQIKALIVPLMLSSSARIQSQLSEALAVIGKHDFPKLWPALLPDLVSNLQKASQASDYASINGILEDSRQWEKMLDSIMTLLSRPEEDTLLEEPDARDVAETVGYTATFVNLHNAGRKEEDPLKDIREPREFLVTSLARLSALSPGKYPQIICENLDPANQNALLQLCSTYNCPIV